MRRTVLRLGCAAGLALGLSGIGTGAAAEEPVPEVNPPPMPVPEMPVPPGFEPVGPAAPEALSPAAPEVPLPLAPALTTGFAGLGDDICSVVDGGCTIPPDTHGAVGPNHLMEVLNTQVQVQDRTGVVVWGPVEIDTFWAPVNPPILPATDPDGVFDPRVLYDPFADRWITVACDEKRVPNPDQSALLVGVTQTPDPTGAWYYTRIDVDGANLVWADYPSVGFNSKWVAVQVNMYNVSDNAFNRSHIYVFDKAELYAGTFSPTLFTLIHLAEPIPALRYGGTQVPAATYDAAEGDLYLLQKWNAGAGLLRLYWITGPANAPVLQGLNTDTPRYSQSPDVWDRSAPGAPDNFAPQEEPPAAVEGCLTCLSGPCLIQTNDDRIQNVVLRNGALWATHTIFLPAGGPNRASVQWWQIDPASPTAPLQRGRVDDNPAVPDGTSFFYAYPSIAVNKHEDVLLGYSRFEAGQYVSGSYSFRTAFDPPNTMQADSLLKAGEACYLKDFTDFGTGRNRWGDYSATIVDPDDTKLWTLQEYAAFPDTGALDPWFRDKWGTWWGMLDTTRTITIADASVAEGDAGPTSLVFDLTLSEATPLTVTVEWSTQDGTATTADGDYTGVAGGLVTFPPGVVSRTLTVDVVGDLKYEADETFVVDLTNPVNADIADPQATGTILNDDPLPLVSIGDVSLLEGNAGPDTTSFIFPVTMDRFSSTDVQVSWATTPVGSTATAGPLPTGDYSANGGTAVIAAGTLATTVVVSAHGDGVPEPDEAFYVELSSPVGGALLKRRGAGIILDDDTGDPPVQAFTAVTGLPVASGETLLQWVNPAGAAPDEVVIRYIPGNGCAFPANELDGAGISIVPGPPGDPQSYLHTGVTDDVEHCYSAFLRYGVTYSTKVDLRAIPFNSTGKLKWRYFTPATVLAAPTVGAPAVTALSNDMYVHAMLRGPSGGPWLGVPWRPWHLGAIAQHRAPTVPLPAGSRAYIATQDGRVHAIDTDFGTPLWTTPLSPPDARGAPAGMFTAWGGAWDYVFAGTSAADDNVFYALDPVSGAEVDTFDDGGGIGAILGMPAVDYANRRVYFTSLKGSDSGTVWCLDLGPPGPTALTLRWKYDVPEAISGSPVLIRGRVYAVDSNSDAWSIEAVDNLDARRFDLGDGDGKGFLFPDRRNMDLYVATQTKVHGLIDDTGGGGWSRKWPEIDLGAGTPSVVLHWPGTDSLFVGVDQHPTTGNAAGVLHIDTTTGSIVNGLQLDPSVQVIGAPSLDIGYDLLHVGSEAGILYAVEVPF